jgi:DNA-binding response OmpR family regulator
MSALIPANPDSNHATEHQPRILIVDDDAAALRLLSIGLTGAGFAVQTAMTGDEALDLIAKAPPEAVVLDFELPGYNGAEVCARIRASETTAVKELPIIMLTAHTAEADEIRCLESGANDFVTKPVSRAVLQARIQTQLRLRAYARQLEEWRSIQEADLASAKATQLAFVPAAKPEVPGWEVHARYTPLIQVGGDIYGWEHLVNGHWLFWMSDSTGHGAAAALTTALTAHLFSKAAETTISPAEILASVNREFRRLMGGNVFMTACCAVVSTDGAMTFSSAGHPPILIVRGDGEIEAHWPERTVLGLGEGISLDETMAILDPGDIALLYTDGLYSLKERDGERMAQKIVEQTAGEGPFGADPIEELVARVRAKSDGGLPDDDIAIIALRRTVAGV